MHRAELGHTHLRIPGRGSPPPPQQRQGGAARVAAYFYEEVGLVARSVFSTRQCLPTSNQDFDLKARIQPHMPVRRNGAPGTQTLSQFQFWGYFRCLKPISTKIRWCRYTSFPQHSTALFIFIDILFFSPLLQSKILALLLDTGMFWPCFSTGNPVRTKLSLPAGPPLKFWVKPLSFFLFGSSSTHF